VPAGAVDDAAIESVEAPAVVTTTGSNEALPTPAGRPLTDSVTSPVNPPLEFTPTEYDAAVPGRTLWLAGVAVRLKSGATTSRVTPAVWVMEPLWPEIVSG